MKSSPRAKTAVDALGIIAGSGPGPISLASVAGDLGLSISYLEQIFSTLRRAGLVASVRGPGGGYRLASSADSITVANVSVLFDETSERACSGPHLTFWGDLHRDVSNIMARRTLADVVAAGNRVQADRTAA